MMTAKEYLSQARKIDIKLKAMAEQLEHLKSAAEYVGVQYSDMPRPVRNIHRSEDAMVRVMDMEKRINAEFIRLTEISATIEQMSDPVLYTLLVKRYLTGEAWQDIAEDMSVSISHLYRLHSAALDEIENLIANESKGH